MDQPEHTDQAAVARRLQRRAAALMRQGWPAAPAPTPPPSGYVEALTAIRVRWWL